MGWVNFVWEKANRHEKFKFASSRKSKKSTADRDWKGLFKINTEQDKLEITKKIFKGREGYNAAKTWCSLTDNDIKNPRIKFPSFVLGLKR